MLKWSPMPQPKHVKMLLMVSDLMVSESSLHVVFKILPRKGKTAWLAALVSLAPPAAESIEKFSTDYFFSLTTVKHFESRINSNSTLQQRR